VLARKGSLRRAEDGAPLTRSAPFRPKKGDDGRLRRDDFDVYCGQLIQSKLQNLTNTTSGPWAASHKKDSDLSALYRRVRTRRGEDKAIMAVLIN